MTKSMPTIREYMTATPHTIGEDQPMSAAHRVMREHRVRHLPVLRGGKLVGVVSDRDLHLLETLRDVDPERVAVSDAMTPEPYHVSADENLDDVVATMALKKFGSAIVMQNNKVVGIFTTIDALDAFAALLRARLEH